MNGGNKQRFASFSKTYSESTKNNLAHMCARLHQLASQALLSHHSHYSALTVTQGAELRRAGVRELDEVCCGAEWRCGQDLSCVAEVQVGQQARQVAHCRRGPDAVLAPLVVPAEPANGAHICISHCESREVYDTF